MMELIKNILIGAALAASCVFTGAPAAAEPSGDEFAKPSNPNRRMWTITDVDPGSEHVEKGYAFRVALDGSDIELKPKGKMKNDWKVSVIMMSDKSTSEQAILCGPVNLKDDGTPAPHEVWLTMDSTSKDKANIVIEVQTGGVCDNQRDAPGGSGRILN